MKFPSKKMIVLIIKKVGSIVILGVVCWWAWHYAQNQKSAMYRAEQKVIDFPNQEAQQTALRKELDRRQHDINRLYTHTPNREGISEVVSLLEEEAERQKIDLSITEIAEEKKIDENGKLIEPTGPLIDVHIKGAATGSPQQLIFFLYTMEHMPYLLRIEEWGLDAVSKGRTRVAPHIPESATEISGNEISFPGQLFFTALITVQYE